VASRFGDFELSPATYELRRAGQRVHLEPRVFEVLAYLVAARDRVVPKEELLDRLWPGQHVSESALTRAIRDLRRALGDTGTRGGWILTVHGRGFRFNGTVVEDAPRAEARPEPTLAVLPFVHLGSDPDDELFAHGVTEDVIAQVSRIGGLRVVARSAAAAATSPDASPQEVGKRLGAAAILDGRVRRAGDRIRIVAELVDTGNGRQMWAETYDRELTDIFAIQSDVALHIASALRRELTVDERQRVKRHPTRSLPAYQLYLQGRFTFGRYTAAGIDKALRYFRQALEVDPTFALAWVGLARVYAELANEGTDAIEPEIAFAHAREAVERALELDDSLGEAHGIRGLLRFACHFDWEGAEREFRRGLELSPGCADIYDHYGWMCMALERYDEAVTLLTRARELDPLAHPTDVAAALLRAGRFTEALATAEQVIEFDPSIARGHSARGWALIELGRVEQGIAALERAVELASGGTMLLGQLGQAYALHGRAEDARRVLARLHELAGERYVSPYHLAYVHTGLGEHDAAIDLLERACAARTPSVAGLKGSFLFAPLRSHPRFRALLRRMNL